MLSEVSVGYAQQRRRRCAGDHRHRSRQPGQRQQTPRSRARCGAGDPATVKLYTNGTCRAPRRRRGTAAQFTGAGITVSVPGDPTTASAPRSTAPATSRPAPTPSTTSRTRPPPTRRSTPAPRARHHHRQPELRLLLLRARLELRVPHRRPDRLGPCSGPADPRPLQHARPGRPHVRGPGRRQAGNPDPTRPAAPSPSTPTPPRPDDRPPPTPASPANNNNPFVKGAAEAGSASPDLHERPTAASGGARSGPRPKFASTGITDPGPRQHDDDVPRRRRPIAGDTSACSDPFTYVEDSTAPETTIDSGPSGSTSDATPTFGFSSSEPGSSFECRFDAGRLRTLLGPRRRPHPRQRPRRRRPRLRGPRHRSGRNADPTPASRSFTVEGADHHRRRQAGDHRHQPREPGEQQQPLRQGDAAEPAARSATSGST